LDARFIPFVEWHARHALRGRATVKLNASRSPSPRAGAAFAFVDIPTTGAYQGFLFGGEGDAGLLDDTWIFSESGWQPLRARPRTLGPGPSARTGAAMACLPASRCLMFGGKAAGGALSSETWLGNETAWSQTAFAQHPSERWGHAMGADPAHGKVYLFGGADAGGTPLNDTWEWTLNQGWKKLSLRLSPPARYGHSMAYDSVRGRLVITGGTGQSSDLVFGDTWELDVDTMTWRARDPEGFFGPRAGHVSFFDEPHNRLIAFGGLTYHDDGKLVASLGDTLAFTGAEKTTDVRLQFDLGVPCSGDAECVSGSCVDGVCCNSTCSGQCGACNLPGREGTCSPVKGPVVGSRPACSGSDECAQCNGLSLASCGVADGLGCGLQGCIGGKFYSAGSCSNRTCSAGSISCAPFNCASSGCLSSCQSSADCFSADYFCASSHACSKYAKIVAASIDPTQPQAFLPATLSVTSDPTFNSGTP